MPFNDKSPAIRQMIDRLAVIRFGRKVSEAIAEGTCVRCSQPAEHRCITAAGKREYDISGLCEYCWDEMMNKGA